MARSVRVGDFQSMQRGATNGATVATASDDGPGPDPTLTVAERLAELTIHPPITADLPLGEVAVRLRTRADLLGIRATGGEVLAEARRRCGQDDPAGDGPREYDVVDGEVRDWRRPDTTPDRGDVTTVHTITDEEPRFSGAGDGQQGLFLVPTDAAFNGRQYRDAPELANIAERLIGEHGFLEQLENCDVRWYWKRKTGVSKGRVKIGFMKRASDLLGHFSGADFIGWLSATTARDGKFTDEQVTAAVFHQLLHIGSDDSGNWIFAPHDFEGFAAEVRVFGTWTSDLKLGGNAFVAAHQMGLFSDEDDDDDDDAEEIQENRPRDPFIGAGVLIHADGTPLTDDEIAEQEAAEERGEEDDEDPLVDHDL
jgi:hypothetical protein